MKTTFLQENARQALSFVQKAVPSRPSLPILSSILIETTENSITLSATDLYFGIKTSFPAKTDEATQFVVPGKQLRDAIFSLPAGNLELTHEDQGIRIKSSAGSTTLQAQESTEYPPFPQMEEKSVEISGKLLQSVVQRTAPSASSDQTRPILTSVLLRVEKDTISAVATDGFRLAMESFPLKTAGGLQQDNILIPAKVLMEVGGIIDQQEVEVAHLTISQELKQVLFTAGNVQVFGRLIEGDFPPFQQIIPSSVETTIKVESDALLEQVRRAMIFSRDGSNIIQMTYSPEELKISAHSPTIGSFEGAVASAQVTTGEGAIAFNAKYVIDFLQHFKQQEVSIGINSATKPALFSASSEPTYTYVVMPFRLNQ